jgi:hypothetical protein
MKKTLLSVLMGSLGVFAQWSQLPQDGGELRDFITTPSGYLVASEGGVFKSTNNGVTWSYSSNGLFAADSSIQCENFATTPTALFVQTGYGIAKSTNDGASWVSAGNNGITGGSGNFSALVSVGNKLYTCKYTNMNTYSIFTSIDDGANWTQGANVYSDNDRPGLFNVGGTVYVTKQDSIFTTATGASLTPMSYTGFPSTGKSIDVLSGDGTYLYAGFQEGGNGAGFYRYSFATSDWAQITTGISPFVFATGPHKAGNDLYVSVLTFSMTLESYKSTNQGTNWSLVSNPGMTASFIEKIYSLGGSNVLGYNPVDGLCLSSDNAASWTPSNTGFKAMVYRDQRNLIYSGGNLITCRDLGIYASNDGGNSFAPSMTGIPPSLHINYSIYNANNTVYTTFFDIAGKYVYKSVDGAATWSLVTYPSPGGSDIEFWGHSNTAIFARTNSELYRSIDGGASWVDVMSNLPGGYNFSTPIVNDGTNIYIIGSSMGGPQVFKSIDNGTSWTPLSMSGIPSNSYLSDNIFVNGGTLMSFWLDASSFPWTYKMSSYTGSNWNTVTTSGLPPNLVSTCSNCGGNGRYAPQWFANASYIYYMSNKGLFMSSDNGASFNAYNNGFYPGIKVERLTTDGTNLFAATEGNSIWKTSVPTSVSAHTKTQSTFEAYPNPAIDYVNISFSKDVVDASSKLVVTNLLGATVLESAIPAGANHMEVSTANLKAGVYFYTITSSSKKSVAKKLVITK